MYCLGLCDRCDKIDKYSNKENKYDKVRIKLLDSFIMGKKCRVELYIITYLLAIIKKVYIYTILVFNLYWMVSCDWSDKKKIVTAINNQDYYMRGIQLLDSFLSEKYCRVESYIITYLFNLVENIFKPITQSIYYFYG